MRSEFVRHDEIRELARRLWEIISRPEPDDLETLARIRLDMATLVRQWIVAEDALLDAILRAAPDLPSSLIREQEIQIQRRRGAYSQHIRDWPMSVVIRDWPGYREAVRTRLGDLESHTQFEDSELYREAMRLMRAA